MSAEETATRRRSRRACDTCRRRKIKCDGPHMPSRACSTCLAIGSECTWRHSPEVYVQLLENRIEKVEELLHNVCPERDLSQMLECSLDLVNQSAVHSSRPSPCPEQLVPPAVSRVMVPPSTSSSEDDEYNPSDDETPDDVKLYNWMLDLDSHQTRPRFFGKALDGMMMMKDVIELKHHMIGAPLETTSNIVGGIRARRPYYWQVPPWEKASLGIAILANSKYEFPDADLLGTLVDSYFTNVNAIFPLLHRPTFDRSVRDGLHFQDNGFARVLLTVCALASRFVDDPRVLLDDCPSHSAGWRYYNQVEMTTVPLLAAPSLYDIQLYCLSISFLHGSSAAKGCWSIVGIAIRLAQDVGVHRRKVYHSSPCAQNELWKRAFWLLVIFDRGTSSGRGQPCAIQEEDFDVELPIDCDDEFWDHPDAEQAFRQPPEKPSSMSFFICYIKLQQVVAFALRTIYSINKSKVSSGFVGHEWERKILSEMNSALNRWVDAIPAHLRWDPDHPDETFFRQSAVLYTFYYVVQVFIHRQFLPRAGQHSLLPLPALAICTNAARACARVLDVQQRRGLNIVPMQMGAAFMSGIVLLLKTWGSQRGGITLDSDRDMEDVYKCMNFLKWCEPKWHQAGRIWSELREFSSIDNSSVPYSPPKSDGQQECIRTDSDSSVRSVGSMNVPTNSKEVVALDELAIPLLGSVCDTNAPTSSPLPSGSSPVIPCTATSCVPGASPGRLYIGQDPGVSLSQGPMDRCSPSSQSHSMISPSLQTGSDWWDDTPLAHYLKQGPFMGETSPDLNLPTFDSTTSFDTLFGMPTGDLSSTWDDALGQTNFSDDEMMAWLNVPADWPLDNWDSWLMGIPNSGSAANDQ